MRKFTVQLKTLGLATVGWSHPAVVKADTVFARRYGYDGSYSVYIPGSSFKGALRSSASRIAEAYGFTSCGETLAWRLHQSGQIDFNTCAVCYIFGHPGKGNSKIVVDDLLPENKVEVHRITHVGLEDTTLARSEHKLYTVEVVPPDTVFSGSIEVEDGLEKNGVKLLMLALAELRLGRLGRNTMIDLRIADGLNLLGEIFGGEAARMLRGLGEWVWG
jgi:CRISPR/Cas system CSM-associated protein Csm3 (group 7 of RAMP superfamily)